MDTEGYSVESLKLCQVKSSLGKKSCNSCGHVRLETTISQTEVDSKKLSTEINSQSNFSLLIYNCCFKQMYPTCLTIKYFELNRKLVRNSLSAGELLDEQVSFLGRMQNRRPNSNPFF